MTTTAPPTNTPVLRVKGLSFSYPARHVLLNLSIDFAPGLSCVRGSNGSGKSTLLKLLAGALPPLVGQLSVQGIDAAQRPLDYRREVFWCGPGAIPFDHLRPTEHFVFLRSLYPRFDAGALDAHITAFKLERFMGTRLSELSTGTQRKIWLAAALVAGTAATLLDEPLNALDADSLLYLRSQLASIADDTARAWIVASHELLGDAQSNAVQCAEISL